MGGHLSFLTIMLGVVLVALSLSVCLGYRMRDLYPDLDALDRTTLLLSPVWLGYTLTLLVNNVLTVPNVNWNSARLLPTFALAEGYDIYHPLDTGLLTGTLYPPLAYLLYLPVVITSTPTGAYLLAGTINGLLLGLPAGIVFLAEYRHDKRFLLLGAMGFCISVWLAFHSYTLRLEAQNIHADIGAVAFGALACVPYLGLRQEPTSGKAFVSSLFVTLAIWTKQPSIAVAVGIPTYLAIAFGIQAAAAYVTRLALVGGAMALVMFAVFGTEDLFFRIFSYPRMSPWNQQAEFSQVAWEVVQSSYAYVLIIGFGMAGISRIRGRPMTADGWSVLFRENSWTLLLTVAVFFLPLSFLQRLRVGGNWNSYHFVYFLVLAAAMVLVAIVRKKGESKPQEGIRLIAYGAIVLALVTSIYHLRDMRGNYTRLESATPRIVYDFFKKHGPVAYFPWNQVATFMAHGEIYHQDLALETMYLADKFPDKLPGPAFLPSHPDYVIFDSSLHYGIFPYGYYEGVLDGKGGYHYENSYRILKFFPNFHRVSGEEAAADTRLHDLPPDWVIFRRKDYPRIEIPGSRPSWWPSPGKS